MVELLITSNLYQPLLSCSILINAVYLFTIQKRSFYENHPDFWPHLVVNNDNFHNFNEKVIIIPTPHSIAKWCNASSYLHERGSNSSLLSLHSTNQLLRYCDTLLGLR